MPEAIGGYFELELPDRRIFPHDEGILLNSGRNALEYALRALGDVNRLFIPFYICDVVLEPLDKLGVPYILYHINHNLELEELPTLQKGEYLLYTNYFGIKDEYVKKLANHYGSQLIVDNVQAWFSKPLQNASTIYSPRKYVGVPDGGVAYCPKSIDEDSFEQDLSFDRCSHLLKRIDLDLSDGYVDFKEISRQLVGQPVKRMSELTRRLLSSIDFEEVKNRRRKNFEYLHEHLKDTNLFEVPSMDTFACPMVYPYLVDDATLRQRLITNNVFVATYWPNVIEWVKEGELERELAEKLLPLPIDQRYGENEMQVICEIVSR